MTYISGPALMKRLREYRHSHALPGLKTKESRERFVEKLVHSELKLRALSMRKFSGSANPHKNDFHPLKAIVDLFEKGQRDEAVWLAFLNTHFGGPDARKTVGLFYGKFGNGRWDWATVCKNPDRIRLWMIAHPKKTNRLRFANHRKYETNNPNNPVGTAAVIYAFREWVNRNSRGLPYDALCLVANNSKSPERGFDRTFLKLDVTRFGRTAKFDFLCLLGNLRILDVSPPHCYLAGATGPKNGALLMVTGKKSGRVTAEVEATIRELQKHLGVQVEVMEDALCGWQKRPKSAPAFAEEGYIATTCG
jgi:alpha-glutamyl/putrescinyl thymine pyrophosphorylase-like protein